MAVTKQELGVVEGVRIELAESSLAGRFSQEELCRAFRAVENRKNWKLPICAAIRESQREVVAAAIEHFTGSEAAFSDEGGRWPDGEKALTVRAAGYYAAVGA